MSSHQSNPKTYLKMKAPAVCPENHLYGLKRLVPGLEASCTEILVGWAPGQRTKAATMLLALLNLAVRGLAPASLSGGGALLLKLIEDRFFGQEKDLDAQAVLANHPQHLDKTPFAAHCCAFLSELESLSPDCCLSLVQALAHHLSVATKYGRGKKISASCSDLIQSIAQDSLATGWAHEYLVEKQTVIETGAKKRLSRSNLPGTNLAKTQFFTPSWISAYLCAEAIAKKSSFTLLDPACGAGHLLVQALQQATENLQPASLSEKSSGSQEERLSRRLAELLGQSLYGLDVDPVLLSLASFALYLSARDLLSETNQSLNTKEVTVKREINFTNLPLPQLFCLESPLGSLALGQTGILPTLHGINGKKMNSTVLPRAYDAIVMNPPYLSTRTMDDTTADFLKEHYQACSGDLYTAFMQLSMALLKPGGRLSTVVQQSFLSISRYRTFRLDLLKNARLVSCVQLGTGAFPSRPGEKVNNAIITLQKNAPAKETADRATADRDTADRTTADRDTADRTIADQERATSTAPLEENQNSEHVIRYLRLQGKSDHDRIKASGLANYPHEIIGHAQAMTLIKSLAGQPFAFHCPQEIAEIFQSEPSLGALKSDFVLTNGLFTCDNQRFVKLASTLAAHERGDYVPYDKGGGQKWYHQTPYCLHWGKDGQAIRDFREERGQSRSLPGESFYFQPGLTYSYIGTQGFSARLLSGGAIFDIASSAVFSLRHDLNYVLGFFNSALVAYLLSLLNPTVNFQIGDLRKLPFKAPDPELESIVADLAGQAVAIVQIIYAAKAKLRPPPNPAEASLMARRESEIQTEIDALVFDHYAVSRRARKAILDDTWVKRGRRPII